MFRSTATAIANAASKFAAYYRARHGNPERKASSDAAAAQEAQHDSAPINKKRKSSGDVKPPAKKTKCKVKVKTEEVKEEARGLRRSPREAASWKVDYAEDSASDDDNDGEIVPFRYSDHVKPPANKTESHTKKETEYMRGSSMAAVAAGEVNYGEESPSDEELIEQYRPKKNSKSPENAGKKKDKEQQLSGIAYTPLPGLNAADESTLPGPGWILGTWTKYKRQTVWISPQRKIMFEHNGSARKFETIRREYNGDEYKAWGVYRERIQRRPGHGRVRVINPKQFDAPGTGTRRLPKYDPLLDAGWERVTRLRNQAYRHHWLSPQYKIEFFFGLGAVEFEKIRQECGGDEEKAWRVFVTKFPTKKVNSFVVGSLEGLEKAKRGKRDEC